MKDDLEDRIYKIRMIIYVDYSLKDVRILMISLW